MFGRPVFPRGAYLSGRFAGFRDPGHFFGKGWLKLEFATLTLPGGTFPLSAKVVSIPHYQANADGSIRGRGHARRDAIEWSLPVLWPEKLITLPMRGPRPTLKGETRILLRVLEDVSIPTDAAATASAALSVPPSSRPSSSLDSRMSQSMNSAVGLNVGRRAAPDVSSNLGSRVSSSTPSGVFPTLRYGGASIPAAEVEHPFGKPRLEIERTIVSEVSQPIERPWRAPRPMFLLRKDGRGYLVTNYWFDTGQLVFVASDGSRQTMPSEELDFEMTAKLNRERGVPFVLRLKATEP
jgi:hypothetical protein